MNELTREQFLAPVIARNTDSDGTLKDPNLLQRMENPICRACHEKYKSKYPNRPFEVKCSGIYQEPELVQIAKAVGADVDDIREVYDPVYWAKKHLRASDDEGNMVPFVARDYQEEILRCTAAMKVDRCARGLGKTTLGVIEELHHAVTRQNYNILFCSPHRNQVEAWYQAMIGHCQADPELSDCVAEHKQQPFPVIKFSNGSTINFFTLGSGSGRKGSSIRTQSPRRVRIDEQDLLNEADYDAINPLLRRYSNSEFHGSSTPTGKLETYYTQCTQSPRFREFHFPITAHPDFSPEMEAECRALARTETRWEHEYLAEWGNLAEGVFKKKYISQAQSDYVYCRCTGDEHAIGCPQPYRDDWVYMIGVDWNSSQTGTSIRVMGWDPGTRKKRMVQALTIGDDEFSNHAAVQAVIQANRRWHAMNVVIDKGFGHVQDEMMRIVGHNAKLSLSGPHREDDIRLLDIQVVDFGASLETNSLVPDDPTETKRRTKPFVVETAQIALESGQTVFSSSDETLFSQLTSYRVKTWDANGRPNSFETVGEVEDHDLTSWMLALLGFGMKFDPEFNRPLLPTSIAFVPSGAAPVLKATLDSQKPNRRSLPQDQSQVRVVAAFPGPSPSYYTAPNHARRNPALPSRTAGLKQNSSRSRFHR